MSTRPKRPQPSALNLASLDSKLSIVITSSVEDAILNGTKRRSIPKRIVHDDILFNVAGCLGIEHGYSVDPEPHVVGGVRVGWGVCDEYKIYPMPEVLISSWATCLQDIE